MSERLERLKAAGREQKAKGGGKRGQRIPRTVSVVLAPASERALHLREIERKRAIPCTQN
jgi:hypothetical protein